MRTALLVLVSAELGAKRALPQGFTPTQGICKTTYTRGADYSADSPTCQGLATGSGSFDATKQGLTKLEHCASFVKEKCEDKELFISFKQPEQGFLDGKTGECVYFKTCACIEQANCKTMASYASQYQTGKVADILPGTEKGNGIEPPVGPDTPVDPKEIEGTADDPTVRLAEAKSMLTKAGAPQKSQLMSIPDAAEIDLKTLRSNPSEILAEARSIGQLEPDCPEDFSAAKRRGEWMCMHGRAALGDVTMYVIGAAVVTWCMCVFTFTMIGKRIRSKHDPDAGEEEEEEEEEEEW